MHCRRLAKRSSRAHAPGVARDGAGLSARTLEPTVPPTTRLGEGEEEEEEEEEEDEEEEARGARKACVKTPGNMWDVPAPEAQKPLPAPPAPDPAEECRGQMIHLLEPEKEHARSVSLLEQKRKVVSSSIDVPHARRSEEEADMDKVTAAMVLTSLSTSPLVRSPPFKASGVSDGSWKDGPFTPSSHSSAGYWSWSVSSDQSNPSTPSPPLSADSFKPFRVPSVGSQAEDGLEEPDGSSLLFDEPIPRKRKNSMKVMFKCLWKNCGKVLSTSAGIQRHIRTVHLGRGCDSDCSDGEEDFYYTEIKLNTDSVAEGLSSLSPVSPSVPQPSESGSRMESAGNGGSNGVTPLSRSAPSTLYLVHTDHAYQATTPVSIPTSMCSPSFTPNSSSSFSISWQSPPVAFTGSAVSPTHSQGLSFTEQRPKVITAVSSPPRASLSLRKSRGEGKKCRKVYGMENRDMWCTACRWKKACQRFVD